MYNIRSHVGRTSHVGVNQILGRISRTSAAPNLPLNPPLPRLKRAKVLLYFALIVSAIKVGSTRLVRHLAEIADADAVSFEAANTNRWRTSASVIDAVEFRAAACGVGGSGDSGSETALTAESCDDVFAYADTDADGALDEAEYGWATSLASGARSLGSHRLFVWLVLWPSRLLFLGLAATIMIGMGDAICAQPPIPPPPPRMKLGVLPPPPRTPLGVFLLLDALCACAIAQLAVGDAVPMQLGSFEAIGSLFVWSTRALTVLQLLTGARPAALVRRCFPFGSVRHAHGSRQAAVAGTAVAPSAASPPPSPPMQPRRPRAALLYSLYLLGWSCGAHARRALPHFSLVMWADWAYRGVGEEGEPERLPLEQQQRFLLGLKSLVLCVALQRAGALAGALLSRREWRAGWREGVRSRLPGEVTLRSMLATLAHQPLAVVVVAPFALLLETVLPHTLSYPFLFDALTHDELRRILLSPFLAVPMLIGGVQGLLALDHGAEEGSGDERRMLSAGGVLARVRALATGLVTACYAGLFEELAFRWLGQPVAMALVYVVVAAGAPMDALLGACGLKLSLPVGAYPFELLGLGLSALSLGLLDLAIRLISAERSCAPAPQAALDLLATYSRTHSLHARPGSF